LKSRLTTSTLLESCRCKITESGEVCRWGAAKVKMSGPVYELMTGWDFRISKA
jgi:hypothetical protein